METPGYGPEEQSTASEGNPAQSEENELIRPNAEDDPNADIPKRSPELDLDRLEEELVAEQREKDRQEFGR